MYTAFIQPYMNFLSPRSRSSFVAWCIGGSKVIQKNIAMLTILVFCLFFIGGVVYVFEFNAVLGMSDTLTDLHLQLQKAENDLDLNQAIYSRVYSTALQSHFGLDTSFERIARIEYIKKKSLVVSSLFVP